MSKVRKALIIVATDVFLFGLAVFVQSIYKAMNGSIIDSYTGPSTTTVFTNQSSVEFIHRIAVPWPEAATSGLWLMFLASVLLLDYAIAYSGPITRTIDRVFNHRITWFVRQPYSEEDIAIAVKSFESQLRRKSALVKEEIDLEKKGN